MLTFLVFGASTLNSWFDWSPSTKQLRQRSCESGGSEGIPRLIVFEAMGPFLLDQAFEDADVFDFRKLDIRCLVRWSPSTKQLGSWVNTEFRPGGQVIIHVHRTYSRLHKGWHRTPDNTGKGHIRIGVFLSGQTKPILSGFYMAPSKKNSFLSGPSICPLLGLIFVWKLVYGSVRLFSSPKSIIRKNKTLCTINSP